MTEITVIIPKEIKPAQFSPKTGNKGPAKLIDMEGRYWTVWDNVLPSVENLVGQQVQVSFQSKEYPKRDGGTGVDRTIVAAHPLNPLASAPAIPATQPQLPAMGHLPAPNVRPGPTDKDVDIAVLALAKDVPHWFAEVMPGDTGAVVKILRTLALAWREYKLPTAAPRTNLQQEMNDEIPF